MKKVILIVALFVFCINSALAGKQDLCSEDCTFVLLSETTGDFQVVNEARSKQRLPPFSTFKIPNSLIALDSGVVDNLEQKLSFDPATYPVEEWWSKNWYAEPINLKDAFSYSAVPVYQEIAVKINPVRMQSFVDQFDYGNRDISSGIDTFWLNGSLNISAREQVAFIQRMYMNEITVAQRSLSLLKEIMLVEETDQYKFYAKTGAGRTDNGRMLGWYVGFIENETGTYYFALNMDGATWSYVKQRRIDIAKNHLSQAGVL